jgi:hypothetical protein
MKTISRCVLTVGVGVALLAGAWFSKKTASPRDLPAAAAPVVPGAGSMSPGPKAQDCASASADSPGEKQLDEARAVDLDWVGDEQQADPPDEVSQDHPPTGVEFQAFASSLGDFFPALDQAAEHRAEAKLYHQYTKDMTATLHLEGERSSLEVMRLTLFDRLGAPAARTEQQAEMIRGFLASSLGNRGRALSGEVEAVLEKATPGMAEAPKQTSWVVGSTTLVLTVVAPYGMVMLTVSADAVS